MVVLQYGGWSFPKEHNKIYASIGVLKRRYKV